MRWNTLASLFLSVCCLTSAPISARSTGTLQLVLTLKAPSQAPHIVGSFYVEGAQRLGAPLAHETLLFIPDYGAQVIHICDMRKSKCLQHIDVQGPLESFAIEDGMLHVKRADQDFWRARFDITHTHNRSRMFVAGGSELAVIEHGSSLFQAAGPWCFQPKWSKVQMPVHDRSDIYIALGDQQRILVIDEQSLVVKRSLYTGAHPSAPLIVGDHLWVYCRQSGVLEAYDKHSGVKVAAAPVGPIDGQPVLVGNKIFVTSLSNNTVRAFRADLQSASSLTLPAGARQPSGSANGRHVFVASMLDGVVTIIDTRNNQIVNSIQMGAHPISATQYGSKLFVTDEGGMITIVDISELN